MNDEYGHTFVVCAYRESRYLEDCIRSLKAQTLKTNILMTTSTPCEHISNVARKYEIPLIIRSGESDIQDDWNFACAQAKTAWVTIAHQDDLYDAHYAEEVMKRVRQTPDAILAFTDYRPLKNGRARRDINCMVKKAIRIPMRSRTLAAEVKWKRRILSLGNTINCPSCAYNKALFQEDIFDSTLKFALDWDTFVKLADTPYPFIYVDKVLVYYRIHPEATSMDYTESLKRKSDEYYMFRKFWPESFINIYYKLFRLSYKTYSYREDVLSNNRNLEERTTDDSQELL